MRNLLFPSLAVTLLVLGYVSREAFGKVSNHLEFYHHDTWDRLGRPGFLTRGASVRSNIIAPIAMQKFLFLREFKGLGDRDLDKIAGRAIVLQIATVVVLVFVLLSGPLGFLS